MQGLEQFGLTLIFLHALLFFWRLIAPVALIIAASALRRCAPKWILVTFIAMAALSTLGAVTPVFVRVVNPQMFGKISMHIAIADLIVAPMFAIGILVLATRMKQMTEPEN